MTARPDTAPGGLLGSDRAVLRSILVALRHPRRPPQSAWVSMCCDTVRDKQNCRSWFPFVPATWGDPLKSDVLEHLDTGRELKARALFRRADGVLMEAVRTLGRRRTSHAMQPASPGILKGWREPLSGRPYAEDAAPAQPLGSPHE